MKSRFPNVFYLFPLIHLAVALPLAYYLNIWADEASTLHTTQSGLMAALENASQEKQAPLYFIFLSIWRLIDESVFFARVFSIICSVLSIGAFFVLAKRFCNEKTAIFATFFFAVHPFLIWTSTEARLYSLVILFTILLIGLFERAYMSDEAYSGWSRYAFTIVAALAFATNYYIGFLLVGLFVSLLAVARWKPAADYLLRMGIVLLLVSPLLWMFFSRIGSDVDGLVFETSALEGIRIIWNHILTFLVPTELFPLEEQTWISFLRLWLVRVAALIAAGILITRRRMPETRFLMLGVQSAVVCIFLLISYFLVGQLYVELRHAAVLFVPLLLFFTAAVHELAPRGKGQFYYYATLMVILTVFYSYALTAVHPNLTKRGDWTRVAEYVERNEKPGQPIVVFRNYEALAFLHSYQGKNLVLPEARYFEWNYEGEIGTPGMWPKQIEYVISVIPKSADEIWLVTEEHCQTGPGCASLENFVKENYTVVTQKDFYKERVRLLKKR